MYPELCRLGPLAIHTYGVALAAAFLLTLTLARQALRHDLKGLVPMDEPALADWAVWAMSGGILGGRAFYVALNWDVYAAHPLEIFALWHGGLVWYGGLAGGVIATWGYLTRRGLGFRRGVDQVIPCVVLGHAVGRLGCFANGCCAGIPTRAWWGVQFPGTVERVVPTQVLESASLVVLFLVLRALQRPAVLRAPGRLFGIYLVGYGLIRWTVECWRANERLWGGWTLYQFLSVGLVLLGLHMCLTSHDEDLSVRRGA